MSWRRVLFIWLSIEGNSEQRVLAGDLVSPFSLWEKGRGRGAKLGGSNLSPLPNPLPKGEGVRTDETMCVALEMIATQGVRRTRTMS
jgi:hypothetical protein